MKRVLHPLIAACLLLPATGGAALAASSTTYDCKSAVPPKDWKAFHEYCSSTAKAAKSAAGASPAAAAAATVFDSRTTVAGANFANVPTWSDADIITQFAATRDARYMTTPDNPSFQRRISWMYPENGCYARAEQVDAKVAAAGKTRPYKLFVFGQLLRVYTDNTPSGMVEWWYHVVPVVKNSAGEPIVFDAALSPCKPLPWKTWLALMADDIASFNNVAGEWGITVADSNAYQPYDPVTGSASQTAQSLTDEVSDLLPREWQRQIDLGRNPSTVLGSTPPWSGNSCVRADLSDATANVPANGTVTVTAKCPFATLNVGGGLIKGSNKLLVTKSARNGNGWDITAKNSGSTATSLTSSAVCLTGAKSNAAITTVSSKLTIANNAWSNMTATCSSGVLVGGGFLSTISGNAMPRIYLNGRTASTGNNWRVSAYNTTGANRDVTSYGYCLTNTNATVTQTETAVDSTGAALAFCSGSSPSVTLLGGGFVFPRTTAYSVDLAYRQFDRSGTGGYFEVDVSPAPANGDANAKSYAQCMTPP